MALKLKDLKADTVGSPSPADVEPPAPSEKPFPQEPSNENFSAEDYGWLPYSQLIRVMRTGNKLGPNPEDIRDIISLI